MEYRCVEPDPVIPDVRLDEFLLGAAARHDPDDIAILDDASGVELTYGDLIDQVGRLAGAFAARGMAPGSVVAAHLPSGPDAAVAFLAVLATGATLALVPPTLCCEEMAAQLAVAGADSLITHESLLGSAVPASVQHGLRDHALVVVPARTGVGPPPALLFAPPYTPYDALLREGAPLDPATIRVDPGTHPAVVAFTSGATGLPKPVALTHRAMVANAVQLHGILGSGCGRRILAFLPFTHIYGLTATLTTGLLAGATLLTMRQFDGRAALRLIERHRATAAYVVPPVASFLATSPTLADFDLSSLTTIVSGGAPLDPAIGRTLAERLGVEVLQGYGLAEMAPVTHVMRHGARHSLDGVGTPVPGVRCRVVDPASGHDVPAPGSTGTPGELWVKGPNVMSQYVAAPRATAAAMDADGWLRTGDLVTIDASGQMRVIDRLAELIPSRGLQVAPAGLESVLRHYPGVADSAVTAIPGSTPGEQRPWALVVLADGAGVGPSKEGLLRYVADHTADYKHLAGVTFVDVVPRSTAGTILRRQLASLLPRDLVPAP
ncbi:MAG: AMP-binding protein [Dermatophilaceae bacterium]